MTMKGGSLLLVLLLPLMIDAYSREPGPGSCESFIPTGHGFESQEFPSIFKITPDSDTYTPNQEIKVRLESVICGREIKGFLIQARPADPSLTFATGSQAIGSFTNVPEGTQPFCQENGVTRAVAHNSNSVKNSVELTWTAPSTAAGHIVFVVTFVEGRSTFWVKQQSEVVQDVSLGEYKVNASAIARPVPCGDLLSKPTECGNTRGCYSDCTSDGCNFYITWLDEGDHVMFTVKSLFAGISQGYIAVGLSEDMKMGGDGVTECVYLNGRVTVSNSQNNGRSNLRLEETLASGGEGRYENGILECSFEIYYNAADVNSLFDVQKDKFLIFAKGTSVEDAKIGKHTNTPIVSASRADLQSTVEVTGEMPTNMFVKIHGSLMVVAWIFSASIGIVIARYFKPQWPDSKACGEAVWFQLHRCFMVLVFAAAASAFVIIFVDVEGYSELGEEASKKAHPILGIIVTALMVINPVMALFRPHPGDANRPIFNWAHFGVGQAAHILAVVTVFLGVNLGRPAIPSYVTWILVGYVAWQVLIELLLVMVGCSTESRDRQENYELAQNGQPVKRQGKKTQKSSPVRQGLLLIHTVAIVGLSVAVVICIIIA